MNRNNFIKGHFDVAVPAYSERQIIRWHIFALIIQIAVGLLIVQLFSKFSHSAGFHEFVNVGLVGYFTDEDMRVFFANFVGFSIGASMLAAASLAIQHMVFPKPYLRGRESGLSKIMAIVLGLLCMFFGVSVFQIF